MDKRMIRYYNRELQHVREAAGEFAREFPKIASRLGLDSFECADPYVERLLEGFAFLTARVQLKLDAEFPRFTQALLETVYPHYLAPTPSMAVVQFKPDPAEGSLADGFALKRGQSLRGTIGKGDQTACEYRTAHDVTLYPIEVTQVEYHTRGLASLQAPTQPGDKAGIRIRLKTGAGGVPFNKINLDRLVFYLHGADETPMRLYEQLFAHARAVVVQPVGNPVRWHEVAPGGSGPGGGAIRQVGFGDDECLLPHTARSFHGYRLLHEYFVIPQRFLFVELAGLKAGVARCKDQELDIIILFRQANLDLENVLTPASFSLFCSPAINLFPRRTDRIHLTERFSEHQVVPDRTRPLDFEVYEVLGVTGYGESAEVTQEFKPFYSARDTDQEGAGSGAYFAVNRVPRTPSTREQQMGRRSSYAGNETYISLVDAAAAPYRTDLKQLGLDVLCTNRDLPLRMPVARGRTDFTMQEGAPIESVRVLSGPTPPRPSHAEGETAWRIVSHLALNYHSLSDTDAGGGAGGGPAGGGGAAALRDLLKLYGETSEPHIKKQIDGVKSVAHRGIMRRAQTPGPIAFARGLEATVTFDESAFEGTGVFLLGAVLEQFFAKYVSINSFTETVVRTLSRGEIMRWPARIGLRHVI